MATPAIINQALRIALGPVSLPADLNLPPGALGLVIFAHGSGSGRFSPRNRHVADLLNAAGFATLLADLLTPEEEAIDQFTRQFRFDIPLLAQRLGDLSVWLTSHPQAGVLRQGYFGASTGAAAALVAAAAQPALIAAVVSRGGRPDLAGKALSRVLAPTLLIVGSADTPVILLNEQARATLPTECELVLIPGATHLFEEPGALDAVAHLARDWFLKYLAAPAPTA